LKKALYKLKQKPRVWYERLTKFLLKRGYKRKGTDKTMYVKKLGAVLMIAQAYVDVIMLRSTSRQMSKNFVEFIQTEFKMSMAGELTFFLRLHIKQMKEWIFISQTKYGNNLVKRFSMEGSKSVRTPINVSQKLSKDKKEQNVDQHLYRSMIGGLLYLTISHHVIAYSVGIYA
jgi:hypothetical protein